MNRRDAEDAEKARKTMPDLEIEKRMTQLAMAQSLLKDAQEIMGAKVERNWCGSVSLKVDVGKSASDLAIGLLEEKVKEVIAPLAADLVARAENLLRSPTVSELAEADAVPY